MTDRKTPPGAPPPLPRAYYARPTLEVARDLLGKTLWRRTADGLVGGLIVETEAYVAAVDPAAHAYRGKTPRNASMFAPPGTAYVYRSYGIHYCLNVVTEDEGVAAAVLLRAIHPTTGLELMRARRGPATPDRDLARGPGRLCQALALTNADDGASLLGSDLWISATRTAALTALLPPVFRVAATPRIGITQATDWPWRFVIAGDPFVSARAVRVVATE
ncbi:MAG TPA: DNA-3-methyladenine glycosylase [Ktedonobacterales bacterium]